MDIRNRAVLVTGASRGLGAALLSELARRGARVVGVARGRAALERAVAGAGGEVHALPGDVADPAAATALAGAAAALVGPIDILIHNASTLGPVPLRPLGDTSDAAFEAALATNLSGPFRLTRALVGAMVLGGRGLIVH